MRADFFRSCLSFLAVSAMAVFPTGSASGEVKHPAKPLLWKVEGKGLAKPCYLFGTIHVGVPEIVNLHPAAQRAFESSDAVYTEVSFDPEDREGVLHMAIRKDGKTLSESLGKDLAVRFAEELNHIDPRLEAGRFDSLQTWLVATMFQNLSDLLAGNKTLDEVLWDRAVKTGKRTGALETFAGNAAIFDAMGENVQVKMMAGTLAHIRECRDLGKDPTKRLISIYSAGDTARLQAEVDSLFREIAKAGGEEAGRIVRESLLDGRNARMATVIGKILRKDSGSIHFFAAGAAHFTSATGIGKHLEEAGYTVTRITE